MKDLMKETLRETCIKEPNPELTSAIMKRLEHRPISMVKQDSTNSSWLFWLFFGFIFLLPLGVGIVGLFAQNWADFELFSQLNLSFSEFFKGAQVYWTEWQTLFVFLLGFALIYSLGKIGGFSQSSQKSA